MQVKILPFSPDHYPAFTTLWNDAYPELERSQVELRMADTLPATGARGRWIAEDDGKPVGFAGFENFEGELYHPRKYRLHLYVSPEFRKRGIGARLFQTVESEIEPHNPLLLSSWVREGREESSRFLSNRGFAAGMQTFHSSLDCARFDLSRLERYVRRLERYGYRFKSFAELASDGARNRKLHELYCELIRDIPSPQPPLLPSRMEYERKISESPELFRAHFVAVHDDEYVGLCMLLPKGRTRRELYADTLGVRRRFRGRGIAQALSHSGIEYARRQGYARISADSFVENVRINSLLENLGFGERSVWTLYSRPAQS